MADKKINLPNPGGDGARLPEHMAFVKEDAIKQLAPVTPVTIHLGCPSCGTSNKVSTRPGSGFVSVKCRTCKKEIPVFNDRYLRNTPYGPN